MFSPLKQANSNDATDVKTLRQSILKIIKEQLQRWEGGEGGAISGVHLFIKAEADKALYEAAVYAGEEGRFQQEVQRLADDFALALPADWKAWVHFTDSFPASAQAAKDLPVATAITTGNRQPAAQQRADAYLKILNGEAEQQQYRFASESRINMGREKTVQTADGFYRINDVAFPAESSHPGNKFISRQHAHIEWDAEAGGFVLFADEGGVPPRNKVKVKPKAGDVVKLQTTQIGYALQTGDQIMLGDGALLEFGYED